MSPRDKKKAKEPYINYYKKIVELNKGKHPSTKWFVEMLDVPGDTVRTWKRGSAPRKGRTPYIKLKTLHMLLLEGKIEFEEQEEEYVITGMDWAQRTCLRCASMFESYGKHNRICLTCKGTDFWAASSSLEPFFVGALSDALTSRK